MEQRKEVAFDHYHGTTMAMFANFQKRQYPGLLKIKKRIYDGGTLTTFDIASIEEALDKAKKVQSIVNKHPELQKIYVKVITMYKDITDRALLNQLQPTQDIWRR